MRLIATDYPKNEGRYFRIINCQDAMDIIHRTIGYKLSMRRKALKEYLTVKNTKDDFVNVY